MTSNDVDQPAATPLRPLLRPAFWAAALLALVMASLPQPPSLPGNPNDKIQHIIAFVTLTSLAAFAYPGARLTAIFLALAGFGGAIELVQAIPALHRQSSPLDWLADAVATGVTLAVIGVWRWWRATEPA